MIVKHDASRSAPSSRGRAAVLDTNVWLDWLVFADPSIESLAAAAGSGRLKLLATARIRAELADVVHRPFFSDWSSRNHKAGPQSPADWLGKFDAAVTICDEPAASDLICTDPDDQVFVDLALVQRAQWLISRDRAVLKLARRAAAGGVRIVMPSGFEISPCPAP